MTTNNSTSISPVIYNSWDEVRRIRDFLLLTSDHIEYKPIQNKLEWLYYRQFLRNVPEIFARPEDVAFPATPPLSI